MPKRKKRHGHFCWVCGRVRANERFSGRGHARHVCRDCAKLGVETLADLQIIRNAERLLRGKWRRNQRKRGHIVRLTEHASPRVRAFAIDVLYGPFAWLAEHSSIAFAWLERDRAWPDSFDDRRSNSDYEFRCENDWNEEFFDPDDGLAIFRVAHPVDSAGDVLANSRDDVGIVWDDLDAIGARLALGIAEDSVGEIDARLRVDDAPLGSDEMLAGLALEDAARWLTDEPVVPIDKVDAFGPKATVAFEDLDSDLSLDGIPF